MTGGGSQGGSFDPKKRFVSVRQRRGRAQKDADWNSPRRRRGSGSFLRAKAVWLTAALIGLALLVALGIAVAGRLTRGSQLGGGPVAALVRPTDGMLVPLHSTLPAIGEGMAPEGIARLELWVNGRLWQSAAFDPAAGETRRIWRWTPSGEGEHLLFVRAIDASGVQADSPIARVIATSQADVRFPVPHLVREGETVARLAETFETDPGAILAANPNLSSEGPLPPGEWITIPIPIPNAPPTDPEGDEPPAPPYSSPLEGSTAASGAMPANLPIPGQEPITPGIEIVGGRLTPGVPMDLLYLYLSINGGPWQRLPESPQTFLEPQDGSFDLTPYIEEWVQAGDPLSIQYRIWGWSGGTLAYLGEGDWMLNPLPDGAIRSLGATQLSIAGEVRDAVEYASEWTIPVPVPGYFHGHILDFRWSSLEQGLEDMIWQVSTQPFPSDAGLLPPGLVGGGSTHNPLEDLFSGFDMPEISGPFGGSIGGGSSGTPGPYKTFSIDFSAYVDTSAWEENPESDNGQDFFGGVADFISTSIQDAFDSLQSLRDLRPQRAYNGNLPRTFYIRLLPILEDHTLGDPSNTVIVRYGPPPAPEVTSDTEAAYDAEVISFDHYRAADPDYAACVVTTQDLRSCSNVFGLPNGLVYSYQVPESLQGVYQQACAMIMPEGTRGCGCPGVSCDSGGSDCSISPTDWGSCVQEGAEWFVEAVKDASNWAANTWEWLKEQAVQVMLEFTPIGWACTWAEEEDETGAVPNGFCHDAMKLALETGMAAMGIPPSLPNFEQLIENGKEYAFQMALQELRDSGLACDSICEDALHAGYDYAFDQVEGGLGSGGGGDGLAPLLYEPHSQAVEQPFTVLIRVERRIDSAGIPEEDLGLCGLSILTHAANDFAGVHVEGSPYEGVGLDLPLLPPGEAITIPVILQRRPWPLPSGVTPEEFAAGYFAETGVLLAAVIDPATGLPVSPGGLGMWEQLYPGSTLEIRLGGPYFGTLSSAGDFLGLPCVAPAEEVIHIPD